MNAHARLTSARPIYGDPRMLEVLEMAKSAARGQGNILILGETGVGKEVMARTLHGSSNRAARPLVCVDCTALVETLVESELFGHRRGVFTGAVEDRIGLLESAQHGTVFFDEIGELPLRMQAKLLRVLESREIARLGELTRRPLDVRFIAATNRDLAREVEAGHFRRDLYFRLCGFTVRLPPLRERKADIVPLAEKFLAELTLSLGVRPAPTFSRRAEAHLRQYLWPGNVRELRSAVERALLFCRGSEVEPEDFVWESAPPLPSSPTPPPEEVQGARPSAEKQAIELALAGCAGNQSRAAKVLGISRNTLLARLDRHGITRPRK
jgi:DNA-binding NtrC family response regulator